MIAFEKFKQAPGQGGQTATGIQKWSMGELPLLRFRIMDVDFAVDMDQVDEMLTPEGFREKGDEPVRIDHLLPFKHNPVVYHDPRVLVIKSRGSMHGILIDQPQNIVHLGIEPLRAFPPLLESCRHNTAVWAGALINDEIVLLLDLEKLLFSEETKLSHV